MAFSLAGIAPNTSSEAAAKKPTLTKKVTVTVGEVEHPMAEEHFIEWIALETQEGNQRKELKPGSKPQAVFMLAETDKAVAAYAYCNLHGLWKAEA